MVQYVVFALFVLIRLLSVFVVNTYFAPDEYWQSLEVGHKLAFGYGYTTWEWSKGIRNYMHPLSVAALYRAMDWFGLDQVEYLILGPRILQAILTACSDYCFCRWSDHSKWSIFLMATSWFWFYTGSRTLLNTVETCLTTIALSLYPSHRSKANHSPEFLWIVAFQCFMRPTAAILWFPLCIIHLRNAKCAKLLIEQYLSIGLCVGGIAVAIDSYMYGRFIVTPYEFFKFNVLENIGSFYGTHPWYWYFIVGLPTILGAFTLPFLIAVIQILRNRDKSPDQYNLLIATTSALIVYSCLAHKEFRFVLPLLPICLHITADSLRTWSRHAAHSTVYLVAVTLLISNAIPAVYFSWMHQTGTIEMMRPIERIAREYRDGDGNRAKFLFLMPCHSTPLYSHVHQNITLRFLTCEPNFANDNHYMDEADQFYNNPIAWLQLHISIHSKLAMPTHLILFDRLVPKIADFLQIYQLITVVHHTEYPDNRVGRTVLLYERRPNEMHEKSIELSQRNVSSPSPNVSHSPYDEF